MLTETADSQGGRFLAERFTMAGCSVTFPRPEQRGERGVMIVSRLATRPLDTGVDYLPHRAVGVTVDTDEGQLEVIGLYVPSRNATAEKTARKRSFLQACRRALAADEGAARIVIGDFNVLEDDLVPRYRFFSPFEYEFYGWFGSAGYVDAFRALHPEALEYSWVGKTGDGYRYDHAFVSGRLADGLRGCSYVHEPGTMSERLTDHSALSVQLSATAAAPLLVTDTSRAEESAAALF
ncbi:endonuclease/exonuclease/phosphatase family protein [Streptomyces sp. MnatMP-M17]|uniref:endonuclease/exonuclease/phosphatase family protein n=1 Tax=unclassified Streptomyces TaxID=2593676 RepID=UPI00081DBE7E|nr:endonuclease/exonuclease/phosphatase family protein [Streptomyces sp. MnatMP-M17]SCF87448.1 exodeoxyribonuclease-3 [Streptomyces sp. MnatMP-M17]